MEGNTPINFHAATMAGEMQNPGISAACRFVINKIYEGKALIQGIEMNPTQELAARRDWVRKALQDGQAEVYVKGRDAASFEECLSLLSGPIWDNLQWYVSLGGYSCSDISPDHEIHSVAKQVRRDTGHETVTRLCFGKT